MRSPIESGLMRRRGAWGLVPALAGERWVIPQSDTPRSHPEAGLAGVLMVPGTAPRAWLGRPITPTPIRDARAMDSPANAPGWQLRGGENQGPHRRTRSWV